MQSIDQSRHEKPVWLCKSESQMKTKQAGFTCFGWNQLSIDSWQAHWSFFFLVKWQHCFLGESVLPIFAETFISDQQPGNVSSGTNHSLPAFNLVPFRPFFGGHLSSDLASRRRCYLLFLKDMVLPSTNPKLLGARKGIIQKNLKMRIAPITFTCLFACVPTFDCFQKTDFPQT